MRKMMCVIEWMHFARDEIRHSSLTMNRVAAKTDYMPKKDNDFGDFLPYLGGSNNPFD